MVPPPGVRGPTIRPCARSVHRRALWESWDLFAAVACVAEAFVALGGGAFAVCGGFAGDAAHGGAHFVACGALAGLLLHAAEGRGAAAVGGRCPGACGIGGGGASVARVDGGGAAVESASASASASA